MVTKSQQEPEPQQTRIRPDDGVACEVCGKFGAYQMGDRAICESCYEGCGSCCPEFGKDDLWTFPEG